ncbi:MAG TPA: calcium/sodium antiporter [Candidatus Uhrbacteria bacterium]|nr:calcium/sodium antiporter [Candidatus Uhrbacteria bacterium]
MLEVIIIYILFVLGFVFLIKGADLLIDGASSLAQKIGISTFVIGITVVAFGTSMPELLVNVFSSAKGAADLAIGNVIGSNISNILLVLGVAAFIYPLTLKKGTIWKEIPLSLLAVFIILLMANDQLIEGKNFSELGRIDGLILIGFFIIFLYYTFGISKITEEDEYTKILSLNKSILFIILGSAGLLIGGKWIVDGAIFIAEQLGLSQALIGLTIVAIGTSLPELAASAVAAFKKKIDIAIGNVVGSNIFNIFWVLGVSASIKTLNFTTALNYDIVFLIFTSLILFLFMFIGRHRVLEKWQGFTFILIYIAYIISLIYRG